MNYREFLQKVIDDGVDAAKWDYRGPDQARKLAGSIAGFEACRRKVPIELAELYAEAQKKRYEASLGLLSKKVTNDDYWAARCYELEVEWVCNVVSAMQKNEGQQQAILRPTARAVMKAAEILGVGKEKKDG
jgi:hypothetical protein